MCPGYHLHKVIYCVLIRFVLNSQSRPLPLPWFSVPKHFPLSWNWNNPVSCKSLWYSRSNIYSEDQAWAPTFTFSSVSSQGGDVVQMVLCRVYCNWMYVFFFPSVSTLWKMFVITHHKGNSCSILRLGGGDERIYVLDSLFIGKPCYYFGHFLDFT